jgi:sugar lactone lactonase YvrE
MVEKKCSDHPMAPHGFLRQASHDAGRYVCECEYWDEDEYNLSIANILEGERITVDDTTEYQESTLEKQEEFEKKRNHEWKPIE